MQKLRYKAFTDEFGVEFSSKQLGIVEIALISYRSHLLLIDDEKQKIVGTYAFDNLFEKKDEWKLKGNWVLVTRNKLMKIKQHITKTTFLLIISHSLNFALPTAVYTKSSSKCELDNIYFSSSNA